VIPKNKKIADKIISIGKKIATNKKDLKKKKGGKVYTFCIAAEAVKRCETRIKSGDHARELQLACKGYALRRCHLVFTSVQLQTFKTEWRELLTKPWKKDDDVRYGNCVLLNQSICSQTAGQTTLW